jgi:hypothetical protein
VLIKTIEQLHKPKFFSIVIHGAHLFQRIVGTFDWAILLHFSRLSTSRQSQFTHEAWARRYHCEPTNGFPKPPCISISPPVYLRLIGELSSQFTTHSRDHQLHKPVWHDHLSYVLALRVVGSYPYAPTVDDRMSKDIRKLIGGDAVTAMDWGRAAWQPASETLKCLQQLRRNMTGSRTGVTSHRWSWPSNKRLAQPVFINMRCQTASLLRSSTDYSRNTQASDACPIHCNDVRAICVQHLDVGGMCSDG